MHITVLPEKKNSLCFQIHLAKAKCMFLAAKTFILSNSDRNKKFPPFQNHRGAVFQQNYHFPQVASTLNFADVFIYLTFIKIMGKLGLPCSLQPSNWIIILLAPRVRGSHWTNIMFVQWWKPIYAWPFIGKCVSRFYRKKNSLCF